MTLRQDGYPRIFRAIEPPPDAVRFLRDEGIERPAVRSSYAGQTRQRIATRVEPVVTDIVSVGPPITMSTLSPAVQAAIVHLEDQHRSILRYPVDQWELSSIRRRYQELLDGESDPATRAALQGRLSHIARQEAAAQSARKIEALLARSRKRDSEAALAQKRIDQAAVAAVTTFDAQGMLQRSSRQVDGQRVYALIGDDGTATAFLRMPPGIPADRWSSRQVGVRGHVGYDENLRARVIDVQEMEPLSPAP